MNLDDLAMSLTWSKIGNLRMYLIQVAVILFNKIDVYNAWLPIKGLMCLLLIAACDVDARPNCWHTICQFLPWKRFPIAHHSWFHSSECGNCFL